MRSTRLTFLSIAGSIFGMLPVLAFGREEAALDLIASLDSEEYQERVKAQHQLADWVRKQPDRRENWLLAQHDAAKEPEARARLREILQDVVIEEHQKKEGKGYVGIRMELAQVLIPGEEKPRAGVNIISVEPGTPANRAGLTANDVIVGIDRVRWKLDVNATEAFYEKVKDLRPGTTVGLEILRAGELLDVPVTLAARPMGLPEARTLIWPNMIEEPLDLEKLEKEARNEFFERWLAEKRAAAASP